MPTPQNRKLLEDAIETIWRQGLALTPDALHYIDSTFSNPSLPELEKILTDESDCERDSLLELIFFPDLSIQARLEDLLESHAFRTADAQEATRALAAKQLQTTLLFPGGRGRLTLPVSAWAAKHFISRLNISKNPDPALVDAIGRHVPQPYQAVCKVMLRNACFRFTRNKIYFLSVFFEKMIAGFQVILTCYDFLLAFLEELEDDSDLYRALSQKKRFYVHNLQKAESFEAQLKSSNMETLIMQGVRMPYFNKEDARRKVGLIDTICYAVFGKSEFLQSGIGNVNLGEFDRHSLPAVLKLLS